LAYLALRKTLKPEEEVAFGEALWSDVEAQDNALPLNTSLHPSVFLRLPAEKDINVRARVRTRLLDADLRETMRFKAPTGTMEIGQKINHLASLTNAARLGLEFPADRAAQMFDDIVAWAPQETDRGDPFAASFAKNFNDGIRLSAGHLLTIAVVPAMRADQRTEQRARNLIAFIPRTRSWTAMGALPLFLPAAPGVTDDIISAIRAGLLGSNFQHVANAAQTIGGWAKLVRDGTLPELPRSLIEQLIATIETRQIGLSAMLGTALILLKDNFLLTQDLERLMQTMSRIRREVRYEDVDFDTMEAVSVSLIRAECVKLAVALKERVADDGSLQAWIDEAKSDPLPEVRFSLAESS
jgi:hypothetical protein